MSTAESHIAKSKPRVVLLGVSLLLVILRSLIHYGLGIRKTGNPSYAIGYCIARAVIAPGIIAALFCIPKNGRNGARFTKAFAITSAAMLLLDLGEIGRNTKP